MTYCRIAEFNADFSYCLLTDESPTSSRPHARDDDAYKFKNEYKPLNRDVEL